MKQKLLLLLTTLMLLVTGNAWGGIVVLYSQDFDAESAIPAGWTQASGTLSLESNGGNKWLRETTAGSGSRTAWYTGTAIKDAIGAYTSYTLEFDCLIKEGTNTTNYAQGVWVLGSNLALSWGTPTSPAIGLMKGSNEATYTISANATATAEKVNLTSNTWYHYVCAYDHSTKKITFSILSADKSSTIYTAKTFDYDYSADGKGVFQSIAFQAGRGSGYTEIDNILLTTEVNEEVVTDPTIAITYAGANRTVTITPGESSESNVVTTYYTLNGDDPTSSSSVYSTPFDVDADCTVKAISISSTSIASAIASQAVTVGKLKLVAPRFTKTGYSAGKYTVNMTSDQSGLAYPPASYTNYYSIDGGAAEAYSAPFELSEGSTVTGYVVATNYTNSDEATLTSAVRPPLVEVWSIDFAGQATEDKGGVTVGDAVFTASGVSFGNISGSFTSNDNFGVKTGSSWMLRNSSRGLYSFNGSGTPVGVQGLKAGQYIKMVVDLSGLNVTDAASLVDDMSTVTEKYIVVNSDGNANINFDRYGYIKSISVCDVVPVSKTISAAGWATFCSPYALDLEHATGLTDAYIVTGGDAGVLTKTSVKNGTVPANTGLLLKGDEGTATIPVVASSSTNVEANKLVGVNAATEIAANAGYVLMGSPSLGFYQNSVAFTVGANTAYLPSNFDGSGARDFFRLEDDFTGINAVEAAEVKAEGLKDGKFLENGKIIIVKNGVKCGANGQILK